MGSTRPETDDQNVLLSLYHQRPGPNLAPVGLFRLTHKGAYELFPWEMVGSIVFRSGLGHFLEVIKVD